jgi:hypothetical protein
MNDKPPCCRSRHRRQFLLRCRRPIHAPRTARTGTDELDNSGCWWLWTRLSSWPVWRLSSQRLLRRCLLRHPCSGRGGGAAGRGSACLPSSLQSVPMLAGLLTDFNINSLTAPPKAGPFALGGCGPIYLRSSQFQSWTRVRIGRTLNPSPTAALPGVGGWRD